MFFGACFLEQPDNKNIVIIDSDPTWGARISDINGKTIFLALLENRPNINAINISALMKSIYAIGEVTNNIIDFRLYIDGVDYWTGNGDYWVMFVLPDERVSYVSWAYVSQGTQNFDKQTVYMSNTDFMPPVYTDLDISGVLPF